MAERADPGFPNSALIDVQVADGVVVITRAVLRRDPVLQVLARDLIRGPSLDNVEELANKQVSGAMRRLPAIGDSAPDGTVPRTPGSPSATRPPRRGSKLSEAFSRV